MADQIVSLRMPASLVSELKDMAEKNHYLDISEEIRSLLRERWREHQDPYSSKLLEIKENVSKSGIPDKISRLKDELKMLLEELENV